jgi:bacteriorhodopsin
MADSSQSTSDQIATLNAQIASDQTGIAAANTSVTTWKYWAIGAAAVAVIAVVIDIFKKNK